MTRGGPLPVNNLRRWNWNGNFTIDLRPLQFKIGGNSTRDKSRRYNHAFSLFNSALNPKRKTETDSYFLKATHTLGSNTFYTATVSYFRTKTRQGDPRFFENVLAYGDTTKNPFLPLPGNNPRTDDFQARFAPFGTTTRVFFKDQSSAITLKGDLTHQQGRIHEFKFGFESRFHTVRRYQVFPLRLASALNANPDARIEDVFKSAFAANIGFDITGQHEVNSGIDKARKPIIAAVYLQDKLEFQDLVLNVGLRWDYVKTDAPTFRDPTNIIITEDGFIDPSQLRGDKTYSNINPRIGLSFPVTDRTVFHAQYGKFTQPPELDRLFIAYVDFANNLQAGNFTQSENPALKPVRTTAYELGFRQQLGDNAALDITAYYKELRDLVQERNIQASPASYAAFVNGDYGTVKGISATFELRRTRRVAATAQYTLQFAGGTGSAADDAFAINWLGNPPVFPTFVAPLSFDQRHTGAINLDLRTLANDGPLFMGGHPFGRVGANLLFTFHSGRPYTPGQIRSAIFDGGPAAQNRPQAAINSATMPFAVNLDAKFDKAFSVGGLDFDVYLWAINLLGNKNVRSVYEQSGEAETDGWLRSVFGQNFLANDPTGHAASFYQARVNNPLNFEQARQYRLGIRFNWR
ncbi:MAG: TonB-dependent receptor [Calditrichaeota bacterium]|nr:MAG: TonB-dependent receptor [Calditrichota bacterium]